MSVILLGVNKKKKNCQQIIENEVLKRPVNFSHSFMEITMHRYIMLAVFL